VLLVAASVLAGAACTPDWRHSGAADTCGTSRDCGPADSGDATTTELPTISGAYRTNAALLATARVALDAMAGVPAPKAEDIPLDQSGLPGAVAIQTAVVPAIGDLRADLGFVAATGRGVPDTMGAAGPTQYLVVLNSVVRSFNKATGQPDGVLDLSLRAFFGGAGIFVCCDPVVRFDRLSGRWFIGAMAGGNILLAVSDAAVLAPTSGWRFFSIPQEVIPPAGNTGCQVDYTHMAVDEHAVYFVFAMLSAGWTGLCPGYDSGQSALFVISKASVLNGGSPQGRAFRGGRFSVPVDQFELGSPYGYIVANGPLGAIDPTDPAGWFYRVSDPGGSPTLSAEIPYWGLPRSRGVVSAVRHRGNVLETGDPNNHLGRMFLATTMSHSVPLRHGRLWLGELWGVDNTGRPGGLTASRNGLGFVEVRDVQGSAPSSVQHGVLFAPSPDNDVHQRNYWMPALMVNGQGHMVLAGSAAGTSEYINAAAAGRLATDPPGTLRPPILLTHATAAYNAIPDPTYRWGDYSNASLDPVDDMTMWVVQQFAVGGDVWGIVVARIRAPGPPPSLSAAPATMTQSTPSVQVAVTGTPVDGEGFFDPGPGFEGRLRAAVDGGVRVNRVDFVSPTSLVLDVSTECAANGPHALTIVNPDGQRVSAQAVLTTNIMPPPVRTPPAAPALSGTAGASAVHLSWSAPASGCEATSFILEAGSAPGASDLFVGSMGTATSVSASVSRGAYYVRVRGTNDVGAGPASNEVQLFVGVPPAPGTPDGLVGTVSGQAVSLAWHPPSSGGAVEAYSLEAGTGAGLANVGVFSLPPGSTTFQTAGVPPATYYLRVRARNAGGTSSPSNELTLVVSSAAPGAPTNLSASVAAGGRVTLGWDPPTTGGAAAGYRLEAGSALGLANLAVVPLPASSTTFAATNVASGRYYVRVLAVNAAGVGTPSNEVTVVVP